MYILNVRECEDSVLQLVSKRGWQRKGKARALALLPDAACRLPVCALATWLLLADGSMCQDLGRLILLNIISAKVLHPTPCTLHASPHTLHCTPLHP